MMAASANVDSSWTTVISELTSYFTRCEHAQDFKNLATDEARIKYIHSIETVGVSIKNWLDEVEVDKQHKCFDTAVQLREKGNDYYKRKAYKLAAKKYTESVFATPSDDNEHLSLCYANRSAALFQMKQYHECLKDIDRAIKHNYRECLVYKLYLRKGHCLKRKNERMQCYRSALEYLECAELSKQRKDALKEEINSCLVLDNSIEGYDEHVKNETPTLFEGSHQHIDFASAAINLDYNAEKGRFVMAGKYIKEGSTLFCEKPFASILLPHFKLTHCHHCYQHTSSLIPCKVCCEAGFCSEECQKEAWDSYHVSECSIMHVLFKIGIAHLSLRVVLMAGIQNLIDLKQKLDVAQNVLPGFTEDGNYQSSYYSVYHLVNHSQKFTIGDVLCHALTALLLLLSLDPITAPDGEKLIPQEYWEYIGSLFMHHSGQLISNAHAITDVLDVLDEENSNVCVVEQVRIATAIYPSASLMNHSCNPNIISSFFKNCLIVRSTRCIREGEEVFNCYGPHYKRMDINERQDVLWQQYFFHCSCDACNADQASLQSGETQKLNEKNDLTHMYIRDGLFNDAITLLKESLALHTEKLPENHKDILAVKDKLAFCYANQGNFAEACNILRNTLASIKVVYGDESIETAYELQKFCDVLVRVVLDPVQGSSAKGNQFRSLLEEAKNAAEKAQHIFTLYFGSWHHDAQEMSETLKELNDLVESSSAIN